MSASFTRTASGITNFHRFVRKRIIVYTEGQDLGGENRGSPYCPDEIYWKSIFSLFGYSDNIRFKSAGSKRNLIKIADDITNKGARNTIVTMDSDHDSFRNKRIDSPYIIYTYGYSWENDVFDRKSIVSAIRYSYSGYKIDSSIVRRIRDCYVSFLKSIKNLVKCNIFCNVNKVSFFEGKYGRVLTNASDGMPVFSKNQFRMMVRSVNKKKKSKLERVSIGRMNVWRNCHGKLCDSFGKKVFSWVLTKVLGISDSLSGKGALISLMARFCDDTNGCLSTESKRYYERLMGRLGQALS